MEFMPLSQSCAVAKSGNFWRATGQSNLVYKRLAATKASKVWFSYSQNCTLANGAVFHSVCQVWSSSGPPEFFTFSDCAWLWNWLIEPNHSPLFLVYLHMCNFFLPAIESHARSCRRSSLPAFSHISSLCSRHRSRCTLAPSFVSG